MSSVRTPWAEFDPPETRTSISAPSCDRPAVSQRWFAALVLVFLIVTRWPLGPAYLYSFDSVNFALALEHFNPALHQPQPPGYPLFVAFTGFLHLVFRRPEDVFLAAGIIAACASVVVIRILASEMFGANAGLIAAVLLLSHPAFWFAGVTNQIRLFLALSSATIALMAWRTIKKDFGAPWLLRAFAVLGIAAGFRPIESMLLVVPILWAWFRTGRSLRLLAAGLVVLLAAITPWIWFTAAAVGGLFRWVHLMWWYALAQFRDSSMLFGANAESASSMVMKAVAWNALGSLVWLWIVPIIPIPRQDSMWRGKAFFLAAWFLPSLLFSSFIHIGDPDQALTSIPVLCVIGGAVLAGLLKRIHRTPSVALTVVSVVVAVVNGLLFFVPPGPVAASSGYDAVRSVDGATEDTVRAIEHLRGGRPVTIIDYGSAVSWRKIAYYFPEDYVVALPYPPPKSATGEQQLVFFHRKGIRPPRSRTSLLPGSTRTICLTGDPNPYRFPSTTSGWRRYGPVLYLDSADPVNVGPYVWNAGSPPAGGPSIK